MKTLRTIHDIIAMLKEVDPDCKVTESFIRRKVSEGDIPSLAVGKKRLIALEDVVDFLNNALR